MRTETSPRQLEEASTALHPKWVAAGAGRDHTLQSGFGSDHPISVPRRPHPHPVAPQREGSYQSTEARGEPDAVKVARPVRAGGLGKRTWSNLTTDTPDSR